MLIQIGLHNQTSEGPVKTQIPSVCESLPKFYAKALPLKSSRFLPLNMRVWDSSIPTRSSNKLRLSEFTQISEFLSFSWILWPFHWLSPGLPLGFHRIQNISLIIVYKIVFKTESYRNWSQGVTRHPVKLLLCLKCSALAKQLQLQWILRGLSINSRIRVGCRQKVSFVMVKYRTFHLKHYLCSFRENWSSNQPYNFLTYPIIMRKIEVVLL